MADFGTRASKELPNAGVDPRLYSNIQTLQYLQHFGAAAVKSDLIGSTGGGGGSGAPYPAPDVFNSLTVSVG